MCECKGAHADDVRIATECIPPIMCGCSSTGYPPLLGNLLGCCGRGKGGQRGKRPESFLTPYEMDQMPLMLRELERANRHFWQMVCWRWAQRLEQLETAKRKNNKTTAKMGSGGGESTAEERAERKKAKGIDDSYADGCALRELVRMLARTLCEKGCLDESAEQMLSSFRVRLMDSRGSGRKESGGVEGRRREFALRGRAISFEAGGGGDKMAHQQQGKASSSTSSSNSSSGYSSGESGGSQTNNGQLAGGRRGRAASWLRQRAHSVRPGRRCACASQQQERVAQLGELLAAEFHSTVFAHPEQFELNERELKVTIWRRFAQMLVAVLNDRDQQQQWESGRKTMAEGR